MWRGFLWLWIVASVLWAGMWIVFGVNNGLIVTPAREVEAPVDRASLGLPSNASEIDLKMAIADAARRGALPKDQHVPASFNPFGAVLVLAFAASVPALTLVLGCVVAGFARSKLRAYISRESGFTP